MDTYGLIARLALPVDLLDVFVDLLRQAVAAF